VGGVAVYQGTDEATTAVVAHQLLTSLAVIAGTSAVLRDRWQDISDDDRENMFRKLEICAVEAAQRLKDLARGCPTRV